MSENQYPTASDLHPIMPPKPPADDAIVFAGNAIEPGIYTGRVTAITPKSITYQGEDRDIFIWSCQIATGEGIGTVEGVTSRATGPSSKLSGWASAILGRTPRPGERVPVADITGKTCMIVVEINAKGYAKVVDLLPARRAAPKPVDDRPAVELDDLPF